MHKNRLHHFQRGGGKCPLLPMRCLRTPRDTALREIGINGWMTGNGQLEKTMPSLPTDGGGDVKTRRLHY